MNPTDGLPPPVRRVVEALYFVVALGFVVYLIRYYITGSGGPTLLAVLLVPVTYILFTLDSLRTNDLYPRLGWIANCAIAGVYVGLAVAVAVYMQVEFMDIRTVRAGFWDNDDLLMGGIMALLILEYSRKRYMPLFVLNVLLILYAVYGWLVPGMFHHPGLSWERVVTAMSVEMTTGVFSRLPQLALTLIGSFVLVLAVLRAFGCIDSILRGASRIAARSPYALPQAAVVGSFGVAAVSGSSAANAATTGSATIPAMIGSGMPRTSAAAVETASSLGGQLMPPIMGISAFLMAEFLGRSYFEVVARGYAPALIYFVGVVVGVYLLSVHHRIEGGVGALGSGRIGWLDGINIGAFATVVIGLVLLMAVGRLPPMLAALKVFMVLGSALLLIFLVTVLRTPERRSPRALAEPVRRFVDTFASMTGDLTLLLATLSIMTGAFVVTGVPTKVGAILMQAGGVHLILLVTVAFLFGALIGTGLPPAPTYILTALVIAPPMIRLGVDPWVVHFFAFFVAVWGELTPPTSVVAAVTAKIADASFMGTLMRALQLCASLFVLMAGVFTRPELVLVPGVAQLGALYLVMVATVATNFVIQARFSDTTATDIALRTVLGALAMLALLHPSYELATAATVPALGLIGYWLVRHRRAATA